jgi:transmembrane sensor
MRIPLWSFLLTIAVIIAILLILPRFIRSKPKPNMYKMQKKTLTAGPGTRPNFVLPDSTQVWLNAGSRLTYKTLPNSDYRQTDMEGEAYFTVASTDTAPFIVSSKDVDLFINGGSILDLNAYRDDSTTQISIFKGSAEVIFHNNTRSHVSLREVDKLIVPQYNWHISMDKPMYLPQDSLYAETAWTKNRLVFFNTSLEGLIPRLERWYNVKIVVNDDQLKKQHFSAIMADPGLSQTLKALQNVSEFRYRIDKNQVFITP